MLSLGLCLHPPHILCHHISVQLKGGTQRLQPPDSNARTVGGLTEETAGSTFTVVFMGYACCICARLCVFCVCVKEREGRGKRERDSREHFSKVLVIKSESFKIC